MCKYCNGTGQMEVDPSNPEEADTPKYVTCWCVLEESEGYDEYDTLED